MKASPRGDSHAARRANSWFVIASLLALSACGDSGPQANEAAPGVGSANSLGGSAQGGSDATLNNTGNMSGNSMNGGQASNSNMTSGTSNGAGGSHPGDASSTSQGGANSTGGVQAMASGGATQAESIVYPDAPLSSLPPEDGSDLWLRFPIVEVQVRLDEYKAAFSQLVVDGTSDTLQIAQRELTQGLAGLLGAQPAVAESPEEDGALIVGTKDSELVSAISLAGDVAALGPDGYMVQRTQDSQGQDVTVVTGNTDVGVLYGSFALLRHLQQHKSVAGLSLTASPKIQHRLLNHWDNLDGSVERGYAGRSIWKWDELPNTISPRYEQYARANASIGINGAVLTNVNATQGINGNMWGSQRAQYFDKVRAIADVMRPYGIRVYLTAPFNAGGNADPNDPNTQKWWADSLNQLYDLVPDFGGLLIKASSEGEPGPSNGATHADGANMLAQAIGDRGIVLWRAFVYSENAASDRIRQAYDEFKPLDGDFADNAFVQVKNGPLDFQPREPFHPMFGGMPETQLALELQITKEYLGQNTHLAYLGSVYEEVLQSDTYAAGQGSSVARVIDGTLDGHQRSAISGVSNVGSDANWTGSQFNQANWYVFGRMAWDPDLGAEEVAEEWIRQTFSNNPAVITPVNSMMMRSRQALVNYMTPLGLVHIMATDHHYGPGPWVNNLSRAEWNPYYYHKADDQQVGFDRTSSGSNAVEQYHDEVRNLFGNRDNVPEDFLLFFHRVGWDETLSSGRTLWEEMVHRYSSGVDEVAVMRNEWDSVSGWIDSTRYDEIAADLLIQHYEARWWRDACLSYFSGQNHKDVPDGYAQPANSLDFYKGLENGTCPPNRDKPRCPQIETGDPSPAVLQ